MGAKLQSRRTWLRRSELNAILTAELRRIPGCEHCSIEAGPKVEISDFESCNWAGFHVLMLSTKRTRDFVQAVAGGCVSVALETYNVVD